MGFWKGCKGMQRLVLALLTAGLGGSTQAIAQDVSIEQLLAQNWRVAGYASQGPNAYILLQNGNRLPHCMVRAGMSTTCLAIK